MNDDFLQIPDPQALAGFFGLTYDDLASILYGMDDARKYAEFRIPKKGGGYRSIKSPCWRLKSIQRTLKDQLYEIYSPRRSAHGFAKQRSIVTNALVHTDRRRSYVFNIDLSDYFGSIHFGRVRNLFEARPFGFKRNVATVLAQICCFQNVLPQGAPTSPIVANMITRKLDRQLEELARRRNATYSRYADDITFSFTCRRWRLPQDIVEAADGLASPGDAVKRLIEENGFKINNVKVRLAGRSQRMEVTGLTVNEFPNVSRRYVRQISSILYAWKKFGLDAAESDFNTEYDSRHRASACPKSLPSVVRGKLAYLKSVRGADNEIYSRLARKFNELRPEDQPALPVKARPARSLLVDPRERRPTAFVSYAHEDVAFVRELERELRRLDVDAWVDERELVIGDRLSRSIKEAIDGREFFLAIVSTAYVDSDWCMDELGYALGDGVNPGHARVLPLRLGDVAIPSSLKDLIRADDPGHTAADHAEQLARAMAAHLSSDPIPADDAADGGDANPR